MSENKEPVSNSGKEKKHNHYGHRQRIYEKFSNGERLLEHELLEMLLFNAIPLKNTNDLAHRLLAKFRSIRAMFDASTEDLQEVEGVGQSVAAYLKCVGLFYTRYYEFQNSLSPKAFSSIEFMKFVEKEYKNEKSEVLDFFLLNSKQEIFDRQRFAHSDFFKVNVSPEEFTRMLLEKKPSAIVAVHNHPFSTSTPSKQDDKTTAQFQVIASFHNILFCDHFICGRDGVYSYYMSGKMKEVTEKYSIGNLTDGASKIVGGMNEKSNS